MAADRWMALSDVLAGSAEDSSLIQRDVIADFSSLADNNAHSVVNKKPLTDHGSGMDLDPRKVS
jgi:hypothetical protein